MGTLATGQNSQLKRVMERTTLSSPGSNREFQNAVFNAGQAFDADATQSPTGVAELPTTDSERAKQLRLLEQQSLEERVAVDAPTFSTKVSASAQPAHLDTAVNMTDVITSVAALISAG